MPGQRYGKRCHARANRDYRRRRKEERARLHDELNVLGRLLRDMQEKARAANESVLTPPTP